jgi:hypothetical protein
LGRTAVWRLDRTLRFPCELRTGTGG